MAILENLHKSFRVDAYKPAALPEDLDKLLHSSAITVPEDYLELVREMTEVEILVNDKKYVRIWGPLGCLEMNEAYQIQKYIPQSLAVGDDEGGMAIIYMTGNKGYGLYKVGFGDLDVDDAQYVAPSIKEFLNKGIGVEVI